ncbi:hypothetical protein ACNKHL_16955 [Shigella flexneri]
MMANRMILNETAWFGRVLLRALTDEVKRRGYQKALIVTDKTLVQCGVVAKSYDTVDVAGLASATRRRSAQPNNYCSKRGARCIPESRRLP